MKRLEKKFEPLMGTDEHRFRTDSLNRDFVVIVCPPSISVYL